MQRFVKNGVESIIGDVDANRNIINLASNVARSISNEQGILVKSVRMELKEGKPSLSGYSSYQDSRVHVKWTPEVLRQYNLLYTYLYNFCGCHVYSFNIQIPRDRDINMANHTITRGKGRRGNLGKMWVNLR